MSRRVSVFLKTEPDGAFFPALSLRPGTAFHVHRPSAKRAALFAMSGVARYAALSYLAPPDTEKNSALRALGRMLVKYLAGTPWKCREKRFIWFDHRDRVGYQAPPDTEKSPVLQALEGRL